MEIDLGSSVVYKVKLNGQEYSLKEPSVKDIIGFQKEMKDDKENIAHTVNFINKLGLPKDICEDLGLAKLKMLVEKITGELQEKK